jgi:hypothetical protein
MSKNENCKFEYIGNLIAEGFTSGYYPYWKLSLSGIHHNELSDATLNHISEYAADGYTEGEVIENCKNKFDRGWWRLEI